jgi:uncharacterized protein YdbL (DUF1318 family)
MIHRRRFLTLFAAALFAATLTAHPALAQSLNKLRSAGVVGEKFNGLAVVRDAGASAKVRKTVEDVNKKRRQIYAKRAAEQGVPADQVGRVYAKQIFQKAPKGTWFQGENGRWTQK